MCSSAELTSSITYCIDCIAEEARCTLGHTSNKTSRALQKRFQHNHCSSSLRGVGVGGGEEEIGLGNFT